MKNGHSAFFLTNPFLLFYLHHFFNKEDHSKEKVISPFFPRKLSKKKIYAQSTKTFFYLIYYRYNFFYIMKYIPQKICLHVYYIYEKKENKKYYVSKEKEKKYHSHEKNAPCDRYIQYLFFFFNFFPKKNRIIPYRE